MTDPGPVVRRFGDEIYVVWPERFTFSFGYFFDTRWGLQAEISVLSEAVGEIGWGQVQLASSESRGKFAKRLETEPAALFDRACREALTLYRTPPAWQVLIPQHLGAVPWFWTDWIPANETTVLYGDGDSGKSLLALTLAACARSGLPLAGTWPIATVSSVLYVDYESSLEQHQHRLALLTRVLEIPTLTDIHYLSAARPLPELGAMLRAQQQRTKAGLVILDSLGAACAGEPESGQSAIAALNTLRQLGPTCTRLVLAHVSKADAALAGNRKAYGSVYVRNLPRANVEIKRQDGVEGLSVTLRVDKNNLLHRKPPDVALTLEATEDGLVWRRGVLSASRIPIRIRALKVLSVHPDDAKSSPMIAEEINADSDSVSSALQVMAKEGLVRRIGQGGHGKGDKATWIRIDSKSYDDDGFSPT